MSENNKEAKPWDILNPNIVYLSEEDSNKRFQICKECPNFIKFTSQCKECKCFMKLKTKMEHASCPIGKW
jgi:hypothetical protein